MGFSEQHGLAQLPGFVERVKMAVVKSAIAVANEDPTTAGHAARVRYAQAALANPESVARCMALGVASNPVVSDKSVDGDIEFTVASMWNAYAGVISGSEGDV